MATKQFTTSGRGSRKPITFRLDDDTYTFTPPKVAGIVLDLFDVTVTPGEEEAARSAARGAFDWLSSGLPEEESERIIGRLRDPDDPLDLPDVVEVIKWLLEKVSGRPPTSRRG